MKDIFALSGPFKAGASVLFACFLIATSLFAQSQIIFCGRLTNQLNQAATHAEFSLEFHTKRDTISHFRLDSFGCGYYEELGIFWISAGKFEQQDTLLLEIENKGTATKCSTLIVVNCDTSRIINLGNFSLVNDSSQQYIFIGDSTKTGANNGRTSSIFDGNTLEDVKANNRLRLHAPYPNPFKPVSRLSITLPFLQHANGDACVYIYNILGIQVWQHTFFNLPAGLNQVAWQGRDKFGHLVPTGNYIVVVESGRQVAKKIITVIN